MNDRETWSANELMLMWGALYKMFGQYGGKADPKGWYRWKKTDDFNNWVDAFAEDLNVSVNAVIAQIEWGLTEQQFVGYKQSVVCLRNKVYAHQYDVIPSSMIPGVWFMTPEEEKEQLRKEEERKKGKRLF